MISVLFVSSHHQIFSPVETVLIENKMKPIWCSNGSQAISLILDTPVQLIIIEEKLPDMTARQLIEAVLLNNPGIHCVVASPITRKEFHQAYEGLGILMQLSAMPGRKEALKLIDRFKHIQALQTTA